MAGRTLLWGSLDQQTAVDVSRLGAGNYLLKIKGSGDNSGTIMFVKY